MSAPESFADVEGSVLDVVRSVMDGFSGRLRSIGYTFAGPTVEVLAEEAYRYSSEVRLWLYRNGDVDDALEMAEHIEC